MEKWGKDVNIALINRSMNKKELAAKLKINYTQLCSVISGGVINEDIKSKVCTYLGVELT